jgi:hypothetical protein
MDLSDCSWQGRSPATSVKVLEREVLLSQAWSVEADSAETVRSFEVVIGLR